MNRISPLRTMGDLLHSLRSEPPEKQRRLAAPRPRTMGDLLPRRRTQPTAFDLEGLNRELFGGASPWALRQTGGGSFLIEPTTMSDIFSGAEQLLPWHELFKEEGNQTWSPFPGESFSRGYLWNFLNRLRDLRRRQEQPRAVPFRHGLLG